MLEIFGASLHAGLFNKSSTSFRESVQKFVESDSAFRFMNSIKGTPAYWKKFKSEVLAMVKQLGIPTFFLTLSCADLRWNEFIEIIQKLNETEVHFSDLSYHERCSILNQNPVLVARHFQYRVEVFFKLFIIDGPLGKTKHYAICVEFQIRGSPHIHSFIWIIGAPNLSSENIDEYTEWVDRHINAHLPEKDSHPELYELVKTNQIHHHSKSCRKYKNELCRFHFGRYFCDRTIVAKPLDDKLSPVEKQSILNRRKELLQRVSDYINYQLNPAKVNIYDEEKEDFVQVKTIEEILDSLGITTADYYNALQISEDEDFQIHLKRPPNSCFVNNYFQVGLQAWRANMDIQPVFNEHKAVAYMCAYLSKSEEVVLKQ